MASPVAKSEFRHDAIFYADDDEFASAAVHFVREGVERDEMVMVNTGANPVTGLLRAMFADEQRVVFGEAAYGKPVGSIDHYKRVMDRALARGVEGFRAMGFLDFDNDYLPWHEWLRYESAVNRVFAHYPFQALCPYDTRDVDPQIVAAMRSAHPTVVEQGRRTPSPDFVEPEQLVTRPGMATPVDPLQLDKPLLELGDVTNLRDLRVDVYSALMFSEFSRDDVDDFVKAVGEVATNGWTHGTRPVRVRVWSHSERLLCTVTDQGPGIDDPLRGYASTFGSAASRSLQPESGLGLWAARQLVDVLDYERADDGFTVRLVAYQRRGHAGQN